MLISKDEITSGQQAQSDSSFMRGAKHVRGAWALVRTAVITGLSLAVLPQAVSAEPILAIDKTFGDVKGWSIGFSNGLGGCLAVATYQDETTVWLGFGGEKGSPFIAFSNPKWRSIEAGKSYSLSLRTHGQGNWNGTFVGVERAGEMGLYAGGLKEKFVIDVARAGGLSVRFSGKTIAQLSLAGSSAALDATFGCQKEYLEAQAKPQSPQTSPAGNQGGGSEKKGGSSSGTGFFVSDRGHVLTNHHVIDGCSVINVAYVGQPPVKAQLVASDTTNDLAVLRTDLNPGAVPSLSLRARIGESIFVYGFPLAGLLTTTGNFTVGNVTATAGLSDDTRMLQISAPVQPGNSGGPLIDQYGNIVGVIVSKLNALAAVEVTQDIPQNVNFAIKTTIALNFLDAHGVVPPTEAKSVAMDSATIAEQAKAFTVRVTCN